MNTWTDIKAAFMDVTRDSDGTFFSADTRVRWAGRALHDMCDAARYIDTPLTKAASSTGQIALTEGGYDVFRVEYDDEVLYPITRDQLRTSTRDWEYRTGKPVYYYLDEMGATPDNLYVGIFEKPAVSEANKMRIWVHAYPAAVSDSAGSTEIEVPDWAVGGVLFYMLWKAYEADTELQNFDTAALYKMLYEDIRDRLVVRSHGRSRKEWIMNQSGQPSMMVINRLPDRVPAP